jgi:hypothetical protein
VLSGAVLRDPGVAALLEGAGGRVSARPDAAPLGGAPFEFWRVTGATN